MKSYEYLGYLIEIHENPIYHDFQFVIKTLDGRIIKGTSTHFYECSEDAERDAQILVNSL